MSELIRCDDDIDADVGCSGVVYKDWRFDGSRWSTWTGTLPRT